MRLILIACVCFAFGACSLDEPSLSTTEQHIDPCMSEPIAPGDPGDDTLTSAQCHLQQTHDAAAASAPFGVVSRVTCQVYSGGVIQCNVTWWGGDVDAQCLAISCMYSSFSGLVCSPVATIAPSFCL